jgi:hypothetical protein
MVAYKRHYGVSELAAAKDQVKVLREVYSTPVWLVLWSKDWRGSYSEGLYIGMGRKIEMPSNIAAECMLIEEIEVA